MPHPDEVSRRRPADVYLPRWSSGGPAALDFAITSGLQIGSLASTAADGPCPSPSTKKVRGLFCVGSAPLLLSIRPSTGRVPPRPLSEPI